MGRPTRLHILRDSGAPKGSIDYTTVVLLHGYAWNSGTFAKLIPIAHQSNARVVLVNRRDYPGAKPYNYKERAQLQAAEDEASSHPEAAQKRIVAFMKERAHEVYELLVHFVAENKTPLARPETNAGGIVLGGWSFAACWMTALLANIASFPIGDVDLGKYLRRIILHDAPYFVFGYAPPENPYLPLSDPSIPVEDVTTVFAHWVSGYYQHGDLPGGRLERRTVLPSPRPTYTTLSAEERASIFYPSAGDPRGGSDAILLPNGDRSGAFAAIWKEALAFPSSKTTAAWGAAEIRYVWCDRSIWMAPWGASKMEEELEAARNAGKKIRNVTLMRVRGANHFVHWDEPERALRAFLTDTPDRLSKYP